MPTRHEFSPQLSGMISYNGNLTMFGFHQLFIVLAK